MSAIATLRFRLAIFFGRLAAWASRVTGKGSGISIKGKVINRLCPNALSRLLHGRKIAIVSGTNGKTTTTHFLAEAAKTLPGGGKVVTNADGANLVQGIIACLSDHPDSELAVLEVDERVVPRILELGEPKVFVMLNFSRDQMDRNFELKSLAQLWREKLTNLAGQSPIVVANSSDPLIVWAAEVAPRVQWVDTRQNFLPDSTLCPHCGQIINRGKTWFCTSCDFTQPKSQWKVDLDKGLVSANSGQDYQLQLRVPGKFNLANAACALVAALCLGGMPGKALKAMREVSSPAGRYSTIDFGNCKARLLLAKNPAGWAESLQLAQSNPVILPVDAKAADGKDLSWLWDVNFEQLQGRKVICTGPRAQDLAVRLTYAEVDHVVIPQLRAALDSVQGTVDVVSTYSPFEALLAMGGAK